MCSLWHGARSLSSWPYEAPTLRRSHHAQLTAMPSRRSIAAIGGALLAAIALCALTVSAARRTPRATTAVQAHRRSSDAKAIAGVRGAIARACPCAEFDGSTPDKTHGKFVKCARTVITDATDGTPVLGAFTLRKECKSEVKQIYAKAACGYAPAEPRVMCCEAKPASGKTKAKAREGGAVRRRSRTGRSLRHACYASPFAPDACSFDADQRVRHAGRAGDRRTSRAPRSPRTRPGSPGVTVTNPKLLAQFGGGGFSLNNARYTRHFLAGPAQQPDAILVLVPGFEGGAADFKILAENLITRAQGAGLVLEVWAVRPALEPARGHGRARDRRGVPEPGDRARLAVRRRARLPLDPLLAAGPNRRARVLRHAGRRAVHGELDEPGLLARHRRRRRPRPARRRATRTSSSAVTRRARASRRATPSTDFNLTGVGPADPGYAKLRGLVLLEGGGGSTGGALAQRRHARPHRGQVRRRPLRRRARQRASLRRRRHAVHDRDRGGRLRRAGAAEVHARHRPRTRSSPGC